MISFFLYPTGQLNTRGIASGDQDDDDGVDRDLSDQDAKPAREPEPTVKQIEDGEMPQSSSASAVYNPDMAWIPQTC